MSKKTALQNALDETPPDTYILCMPVVLMGIAEPVPNLSFGFFISRTMIGEESRSAHDRNGALFYFEQ
ncbi:MAG: hypothetical protein NTV89_14880 [Proteobacteria bacterium]|nr:hypothetical protein [Pseudomonadota bacterium]